MHQRISPTTKAWTLLGLAALICLGLGFNALAAADEKPVTDAVTAPSVVIKWDHSAQRMSTVEAAQAAQLMEQFRGQLEARMVATGRLAPVGELEVKSTPSGLKMAKATVDMMNFAVVRVDQEGQLVQACTDDPAATEELLTSPAPAAEQKMEEQ